MRKGWLKRSLLNVRLMLSRERKCTWTTYWNWLTASGRRCPCSADSFRKKT